METELHRQLKYHFAADRQSVEVVVDSYRIDALDRDGYLVEIQHAGLGSIRRKVKDLLQQEYVLRVVKPLIVAKTIETLAHRQGPTLRRRRSPKKAQAIDLFKELIHFTDVFPHPNLSLEIVEVECLEQRVDIPESERRHRRAKRYQSLDQHLMKLGSHTTLRTSEDLWALLQHPTLPQNFDSQELAQAVGVPRWFAQQIAYCLHRTGGASRCGKRGNTLIYQKTVTASTRKKRRRAG